MGVEGANVLFDSWVQPLMMGLEEHLLQMFRGDFEFHEDAPPSHLGRAAGRAMSAAVVTAEAADDAEVAPAGPVADAAMAGAAIWSPEAERELRKVPFFVRAKARRNTERFASERAVHRITVETLYDAKAHFSR